MQKRLVGSLLFIMLVACAPAEKPKPVTEAKEGIWVSRDFVRGLPMEGEAWEQLDLETLFSSGLVNLADQEDPVSTRLLGKAYVGLRKNDEKMLEAVRKGCLEAMGTEVGARTLALSREILAVVVAADLVGLPEKDDLRFKAWLRELRYQEFQGKTLISTHEQKPNNWGTSAGAARAAIACYLNDEEDLARSALILKAWMGDYDLYHDFKYKNKAWQADPERPLGINPKGATREGHSIDGVLPEEMRRSTTFFLWPPPKENYVYTALQGVVTHAVILYRAGYTDVWNWEDKAILRAFQWLYEEADFPAVGNDVWMLYLINYYYGTDYAVPRKAEAGKNMAWTDWTHQVRQPGKD